MPVVVSCPSCRASLSVPNKIIVARGFPWAWLITIFLVAIVVAAIGFGGGWFAARHQPAGAVAANQPAPIDGKPANNQATAVAPNKTPDAMNWQDLQDLLTSKGIITRRGPGKLGMWFARDNYLITSTGTGPLMRGDIAGLESCVMDGGRSFFGNHFVVKEHVTAKAAQDEAARVLDVTQYRIVAWGRFTFDGQQGTLELLRATLN